VEITAGGYEQQLEQVLAGERGAAEAVDGRVGEGPLAGVELEDLLLDGVLGDDAVDEDGALLADAVAAVGGLVLDGGVPPGVEQVHVIRGGEVQAGAAAAQGYEHLCEPKTQGRGTKRV
jgi:hypothetical protein